MQLAHINIKPGNIFIARAKRLHTCNYDSPGDDLEEDETERTEEDTYKIGKSCMREVHVNTSSSQLEGNIIYILTSCVFETNMIFYLHYNN
jgi:hypothetical protein